MRRNLADNFKIKQAPSYSTVQTVCGAASRHHPMRLAVLLGALLSVDAYQALFLPAKSRSLSRLAQASTATASDVAALYTVAGATSASILQASNAPVPRAYQPSVLRVSRSGEEPFAYDQVERAIALYLDGGGRISKLFAAADPSDAALKTFLSSMGFHEVSAQVLADAALASVVAKHGLDALDLYMSVSSDLRAHCERRLPHHEGTGDVLHDICGRLLHDAGDSAEAINSYTSALLVNPKSAAVFRNLGSAYHAKGDLQLAFASYQQALQLDESDFLVYLKIAYLYEDLAAKDWKEAAEHARKCYDFYLAKVDAEDTSVLTRLGNLAMKEHDYEAAAAVYGRALALEDGLFNVWFNLAYAQVKLGDYSSAMLSLRRTIELEPSVAAARHMLKVTYPRPCIPCTVHANECCTGAVRRGLRVSDGAGG